MSVLPFLDTPHAALDGAASAAALGQKGALLRRLVELGAPVPPAFHVPVERARALASGEPASLAELDRALDALAERSRAPDGRSLCVAVRSSPFESRPGALPTVLCAGASHDALPRLELRLGGRVAALDARARYLRGIARARGAGAASSSRGVRSSASMPGEADLSREIGSLEAQLGMDATATSRAEIARAVQEVARASECALLVQMMVFGSAGGASGAGAASSRHPITGEPVVFGEIAWGRLGEDVSLGRGAGVSLRRAAAGRRGDESLEARAPEVLAELARWLDTLERALDRVVDVELAVESGRLALVQARPTVLTPRAEVRVAVDLAREGRWARSQAIRRVSVSSMARVGRIELVDDAELARAGCTILGSGLGASPGAASGTVAIDVGDALERAARGERVVLVRSDASPEDAPAVRAAVAVATASGGLTSHAAVMSRALGRPCAVSVSSLAVRETEILVAGGPRRLVPGDAVTVDGTRGRLLSGTAPTRWVSDDDSPRELAAWAREIDETWILVDHVPGTDPRERALALGADGVWDGRQIAGTRLEAPTSSPVRWGGPEAALPPAGAPWLVGADQVAAARVAAAQRALDAPPAT